MNRAVFGLTTLLALVAAGVRAGERSFCTEDTCADDTFAVRFGNPADRVSELRGLEIGSEFTITVTADVVTPDSVAETAGWGFGIEHDPAKLEIVSLEKVTSLPDGFVYEVQLADGDPTPGFIAAWIASIANFKLDPGTDIPLARATYRVIGELDPAMPTLLEFTSNFKPQGAQPQTPVTEVLFTQNTPDTTVSLQPKTVVDGEIFGKGAGDCDSYGLYFGPDPSLATYTIDGDEFPISLRTGTEALGFSLGVSIDDTAYSFANEQLGSTDNRPLTQLVITDIGATEFLPQTNTATGPSPAEKAVTDIRLGADLAAFGGGELLYEAQASAGGPGFWAAYAVDITGTQDVIPVTPQGDPCPVHEALIVSYEEVVTTCPDWGYFFGDDPSVEDLQVSGDSFSIATRNARQVIGFSLGVKTDAGSYAFVDRVLGETAGREVDLVISDDQAVEHFLPGAATPGPNTATDLEINSASGPDVPIRDVLPGAAITAPENLFLDLDPVVGGTGFTALYVPDLAGTEDLLPITPATEECPINEILIVELDVQVGNRPFNRGDCNGDGRLNVTDGALCAQNIFLGELRPQLVFFDCDDMLDANDDGMLDTTDPIVILEWVFRAAPNLPAPFFTCEVDGTEDELDCLEANCEPNP